MSEPDFNILSLPDCVAAEIDQRIESLRDELQHRNAHAMIEPLRRLSRIRGNFAFDLIAASRGLRKRSATARRAIIGSSAASK